MTSATRNFPVFFFHGLTATSAAGDNIKAKLLSDGRAFVALTFAEGENSLEGIMSQIPKAIAEIREVVASDTRFDEGYVFVGHSMGGLIARAVIEEMDDHKVHTLVTLASPHFGLFYGPQEADSIPSTHLPAGLGELMIPSSVFSFKTYSNEDYRGKMQQDFARLTLNDDVQTSNAFVNLAWIPVRKLWLSSNIVHSIYLNAPENDQLETEKQRRKTNFLKLKELHAFASPNDGVAAPWQTGVFGHYSEVNAMDEIESSFEGLRMLDMKLTVEYKNDSYGLRTLDERGALFRHVVPDVPHTGWLLDTGLMDKNSMCKFDVIFENYVRPTLSKEST